MIINFVLCSTKVESFRSFGKLCAGSKLLNEQENACHHEDTKDSEIIHARRIRRSLPRNFASGRRKRVPLTSLLVTPIIG